MAKKASPLRGFTLIEMMTVVAIAGILTSITVVGLQETQAATIESKCARNVAQLMKRARAESVAEHKRVGVRINTERKVIELTSCKQRFGEETCVSGTDFLPIAGTEIRFDREYRGVRVDAPAAAGAGGNIVVFNADGFPDLAEASTWRFDHTATTGSQEVIVSIGGDVRTAASSEVVAVNELAVN